MLGREGPEIGGCRTYLRGHPARFWSTSSPRRRFSLVLRPDG